MKQGKNKELNNKDLDNISGGSHASTSFGGGPRDSSAFIYAEDCSGDIRRYDGYCSFSTENGVEMTSTRTISVRDK